MTGKDCNCNCDCGCDCGGSAAKPMDGVGATGAPDCPDGFTANVSIKNTTNVPLYLRPNTGGLAQIKIEVGAVWTSQDAGIRFANHTTMELDWNAVGGIDQAGASGVISFSNGGGVGITPGGAYVSGDTNNSLQASGSVVSGGGSPETFSVNGANPKDPNDPSRTWNNQGRSCSYDISVTFSGNLPESYSQGTTIENQTDVDVTVMAAGTTSTIHAGDSKSWDGGNSYSISFWNSEKTSEAAAALSVSYQQGVSLSITANASKYLFSVTATPKGGTAVTKTLCEVSATPTSIISGDLFQSGGSVDLKILQPGSATCDSSDESSDSHLKGFC